MVKLERFDKLRRAIDRVDEAIVRLLDLRRELVKLIGEIKREMGKEIIDVAREREVLQRAGEYKEIFKKIIEYSREVQRNEC